jgi:hypothetical protein
MKRNLHVRFCRRAGEGDLPRLASVIRNEESLNQIREYIMGNPAQWLDDPEHPQAGKRGPGTQH